MSTTPTPPPAEQPAKQSQSAREILIIQHSTLFYWWPVWASGFIFFLLSQFSESRIAIVPKGSEVAKIAADKDVHADLAGADEKGNSRNLKGKYVVIVEPDNVPGKTEEDKNKALAPKLHIARSKNLGVLFCTILLLVIIITNVHLRGLWSVIVIMVIVFLSIIFAILDWWERILTGLSFLDVRINAAGYLTISLVLFVIWCLVFFLFDKQIYMVFTPGQLRVRTEIGEGETSYDTTGMTTEKLRSDLFRHWILGLGSGDLLVHTSGAQARDFAFHNVLRLGRRHREIEEMLRQRPVVTSM